MGILDQILQKKREELTWLRHRKLPSPPPVRPLPFAPGEMRGVHIIAEIKHRSPSAGPLSTRLSVEERARCYERAGASIISVLCDETFFGGSYEQLAAARESCSLPLLCKEFVIDEVQLDAARAYGADLVLLIVRCLDERSLGRLHAAAIARGLHPLVEVTTEEEAQVAMDAGACVIGVNARDLDTLKMDPARATRVLEALSDGAIRLHLSGIATPDDVRRLASTRINGALIGEVLMRADDPEACLRALVDAARAP